MKYTKDGKFRQFAFVGYETDSEASQAIKNLNKSFVNTSRISVEVCAALSDENKPKSWSKYSKDSSAFQKKNGVNESKDDGVSEESGGKSHRKEKKKKNEKIQEILGEHLKDPKFIEFMDVHAKGRSVWKNDLGLAEEEDDDGVGSKETETETAADETTEAISVERQDDVKAADEEISDSEYMKRLIPEKSNEKQSAKKAAKIKVPKLIDLLTIKVRNIPFKAKRQDILTFFKPIKPFSIRLPVKVHGICYVGFKTEADFKKAMLKNRSFWSK